MPPTGQLCPQLDSCAPNWTAVPPTGQLCPQLDSCAPNWSAMPPAGQLCPQLDSCAPNWSAMPPAGQLCPQLDSCAASLQWTTDNTAATCCCSLTEVTTVLSPASVSAVNSTSINFTHTHKHFNGHFHVHMAYQVVPTVLGRWSPLFSEMDFLVFSSGVVVVTKVLMPRQWYESIEAKTQIRHM